MTDPLDRFLLGGDASAGPAAGPPDAALAEPLARWATLRAALAADLDAALPDTDALVLAGLDAARSDALGAEDRAQLVAARHALDAATADHPALALAVARVGRDADAFEAAWAEAGLGGETAPPAVRPRAPARAADRTPQRPTRRESRWVGRSVALMGVLAFAVLSTYTLLRDRGFETLAAGDTARTVAFADGSTATLAPGTTLLARVESGGEREVRLRAGEAYFEVAHDPARPFSVETENAFTTVLGTTFTVRVAQAQTEVVLVTGAVTLAPRGGESVTLAPGQRSRVTALDAATPPAPADVNAALAWTGRVVARETAAADVAARLAEHYGAPLDLDASLAGEPVSGVFGADGLEDAARTLALALGGRAEGSAATGFRIVAE